MGWLSGARMPPPGARAQGAVAGDILERVRARARVSRSKFHKIRAPQCHSAVKMGGRTVVRSYTKDKSARGRVSLMRHDACGTPRNGGTAVCPKSDLGKAVAVDTPSLRPAMSYAGAVWWASPSSRAENSHSRASGANLRQLSVDRIEKWAGGGGGSPDADSPGGGSPGGGSPQGGGGGPPDAKAHRLPVVPGRYKESVARKQHNKSRKVKRFHKDLNDSAESLGWNHTLDTANFAASHRSSSFGELEEGFDSRFHFSGAKASFHHPANSFASHSSMSPARISAGALRRGGLEGLTGSHGARMGWNTMHMGGNYTAINRSWEGHTKIYSRNTLRRPSTRAALAVASELDRFEKQTLLHIPTYAGRTFREFEDRDAESTLHKYPAQQAELEKLMVEDEHRAATQIQRVVRGRQTRRRVWKRDYDRLVREREQRQEAIERKKEAERGAAERELAEIEEMNQQTLALQQAKEAAEAAEAAEALEEGAEAHSELEENLQGFKEVE